MKWHFDMLNEGTKMINSDTWWANCTNRSGSKANLTKHESIQDCISKTMQ